MVAVAGINGSFVLGSAQFALGAFLVPMEDDLGWDSSVIFGALALSPHRGTASMGLLLTLAIGLTMASTLVVLPALLHALEARRAARRPGAG